MNNTIVCAPGSAARLALRGLIGAIHQFAAEPSHDTHQVLADWEGAFEDIRSTEIRLARVNGRGSAGRASSAARQCPCGKSSPQTPAVHESSRHFVAGLPARAIAVASGTFLSDANAQQPGGGV